MPATKAAGERREPLKDPAIAEHGVSGKRCRRAAALQLKSRTPPGLGLAAQQPQPRKFASLSIANSMGKHRRSSNDPSAGSPTETLLRLLLPLNVQV